MMMKNTMNNR